MSEKDPGGDAQEQAAIRGIRHGRWKRDRSAVEREALHEHWTRRDLIDAVREAKDRGDEVAIHLPGPRTLKGHIVGVGRDYAVLRCGSQPPRDYAVRLGAPTDRTGDLYAGPMLYLEIHAGHQHEALLGTADDLPPTFQAVLQQYDFHQQNNPLLMAEIGTLFHPKGLNCSLNAHAGDHLYIQDPQGNGILLPLGSVTYITLPNQRQGQRPRASSNRSADGRAGAISHGIGRGLCSSVAGSGRARGRAGLTELIAGRTPPRSSAHEAGGGSVGAAYEAPGRALRLALGTGRIGRDVGRDGVG